jgi:uncharacterized protein YmfQ (DUF2313 family)
MARSTDEYIRLLQALLPRGPAWNRDPDSTLSDVLYSFAAELARLEDRAEDLLTEANTLYTTELLGEYEADFGIPDECIARAATVDRRREVVHAQLLAQGGQHPGYYMALANNLDRILYIVEFTPFWAGAGECGDFCGDQKTIFYWGAVFGYHNGFVDWFEAGDECAGDLLGDMPYVTQLICMLERHRPAQTVILYYFYGPEFNTEFSCGINSMPSTQSVFRDGDFGEAFDVAEFDAHAWDYGGMVAYWSGSFSRAYCSVEADAYKGTDLSIYFMGAFGYGFG